MRQELKPFEEKMNKAITFYTNDINTIRAGRANPAVLDKVQVEYYGVPSPLNQVGTVSVPEPTMIVIQPWDATLLPEIEKAIKDAGYSNVYLIIKNNIVHVIVKVSEPSSLDAANIIKIIFHNFVFAI